MPWYHVYILRSQKDKSFYTGCTSDLKSRIKNHNAGNTKSTKSKIPYSLVYCETYRNKTTALKREIQLKKNRMEKMKILIRIFPEEGFKL